MLRIVTLLLLPLLLLLQDGDAKVVDIRSEAFFIVSRHNEVRRSREVDASDMLEMRWDEDLAQRASSFAERCEYQRPRENGINANLYFTSDHVHGEQTIHKWLDSAVDSWRRVRERYTYSSNCGRACAYVQMIMARTDRIGCALSLCDNVRAGNYVVDYGSLFVCYYYPGEDLMNTYPYTRGSQCSRCDSRMECREGLCRIPGTEIVPREFISRTRSTGPQPIVEFRDKLTQEEARSLVDSHNKMRQGNRINANLRWDPFLQRWAEWIVHCTVDYPGPRHTYTNFERMEHTTNVYDVVSTWSTEGSNTNLRMEHGCRTPSDETEKCNHFTNVLNEDVTTMACATRNCGDEGRQLVCLYDNRAQRPARRRTYSQQEPSNQRYTARITTRRYDQPRRTTPRRYDPSGRTDLRQYDAQRRANVQRRYDQQMKGLSYEERRRRYYERLRMERQRRRDERI